MPNPTASYVSYGMAYEYVKNYRMLKGIRVWFVIPFLKKKKSSTVHIYRSITWDVEHAAIDFFRSLFRCTRLMEYT